MSLISAMRARRGIHLETEGIRAQTVLASARAVFEEGERLDKLAIQEREEFDRWEAAELAAGRPV